MKDSNHRPYISAAIDSINIQTSLLRNIQVIQCQCHRYRASSTLYPINDKLQNVIISNNIYTNVNSSKVLRSA